MTQAKNMMPGGVPAGMAKAINGAVAATVSAAGTTQGTATSLKADINYISTAAASSGVILPAAETSDSLIVYNGGANAVLVYPPLGAKINAAATNGGVSVATGTRCDFTCVTATQWIGNLSA